MTKNPDYDLVTGRILKELPDMGFKCISQLFNAILRIKYLIRRLKCCPDYHDLEARQASCKLLTTN